LLAPEFYAPLRNLGTQYHAGNAGLKAAESIFAVLDSPLPSGEGKGLAAAPSLFRQPISFNNVSFSYTEGNPGVGGRDGTGRQGLNDGIGRTVAFGQLPENIADGARGHAGRVQATHDAAGAGTR